jgi:type VI secretion system protein ImpK
MAPLSRWKLIFLASMICLLAVSELLWLWPTWQLRQTLHDSGSLLQLSKP